MVKIHYRVGHAQYHLMLRVFRILTRFNDEPVKAECAYHLLRKRAKGFLSSLSPRYFIVAMQARRR